MLKTIIIFILTIIILLQFFHYHTPDIDKIRETLISKGLPTPAFASARELQNILAKYG